MLPNEQPRSFFANTAIVFWQTVTLAELVRTAVMKRHAAINAKSAANF